MNALHIVFLTVLIWYADVSTGLQYSYKVILWQRDSTAVMPQLRQHSLLRDDEIITFIYVPFGSSWTNIAICLNYFFHERTQRIYFVLVEPSEN